MLSPELEAKYKEDLRRIEESYKDSSYQRKLKKYFELIEQANEKYSVLNSLGILSGEKASDLIELCRSCIKVEADIKAKREYYENCTFPVSPPYKLLAMIYEKRCEYDNVISTCVEAIRAGYATDGTKGGMRGRIARAIKKGTIELTEDLRAVLEI